MVVHCLFEQSGTFKNEFKKLGIQAYDYDIEDNYHQTDYQTDLFNQIKLGYLGAEYSLFDDIKKDDLIIAFFPCVRFSVNSQLQFRCDTPQLKAWDDIRKINYVRNFHNELSKLYELFCEFVILCLERGFKLIIENPYSKDHYLTRFFPIKSKLIDMDRSKRGDNMKKPTQYWFINCEPKNNFVNEEVNIKQNIILEKNIGTAKRSEISPDYARRFIKEFIL